MRSTTIEGSTARSETAASETAATQGDAEAMSEPMVDSEPMARLRPDEPMGMQLARARVLGALFGEDSATGAFGRFRVLGRLGAGGMGVVYEAYDPDLARGVALKLVNVAAKDREGALAEAKALARLSHPNVVPIYDVGIERDHVFLVMELVRGQTLRGWAVDRAPRDLVAVYHQAGLALAAAHDAGLVHRDFKPENAIVGRDGRVRVVDFGLACEADDPARATEEPRRLAGTPRFMAPEIRSGAAITPAADQYSFCVALAEALERASEPAPRRLIPILERGRSSEPAQRFPSMTELLHAIARDPARTRRRVAAAVAIAAMVGGGAFLLGRRNAGVAAAPSCDDGAAQLEAVWSPGARTGALERLATLGAYGQSIRPQLARALDDHARRWVAHDRAACLDRRRGIESSALSDRRTACLRRGSDALAAVGELITRAEPANLAELPRALQSMPDPASCSDLEALVSDVPPPPRERAAEVAEVQRRVTQARIHLGAGRYDQAFRDGGAAVARARALGYEPVLAEALLVQGHARMYLDDRGAAVPLLTEAMTLAVSSHDDEMEVEAWARRAWAKGTSRDPDGALGGLDVIEPHARRTRSPFVRALLYNNVGSVELGRDRARARAYLERALVESQHVAGPGALELLALRVNIAVATDDRGRGDQLLAEAAAALGERLGADHPDALEARRLRGFKTIVNLTQAEQQLIPVCRDFGLHADLTAIAANCWTEVGMLRWDLGDDAAALEAMERAASSPGQPPEAAPYVALLRGDARAAAGQFAKALAALPPLDEAQWWQRFGRARLALGLGRSRRALGDLRGARDALNTAIADYEVIVSKDAIACYERRLGRARAELAYTLAALGAASSERAAAATAAAAWLAAVGGPPREIDKLRIR